MFGKWLLVALLLSIGRRLSRGKGMDVAHEQSSFISSADQTPGE